MSEKTNLDYGTKMALLAIAEIIVLASFKASVGLYTGLIVLLADALSSVADLLTLFATYMGLKISKRHADKSFKYGYYKAETFAALITSLIIVYFGLEILWESIKRISENSEAKQQGLAILVIVVTIMVSLHLSKLLFKTGKKINSLALIATAKEKKLDLLLQLAVLLGVGANYFRIPYVEGLAGVFISLLTIKEGLGTAKESLFFLLDYFDDQDLVNKIHATILQNSHIVSEVRDIRMRRAGTVIFGEAFVEVSPNAQTKDIRSDLSKMKEKIMRTNEYLKNFLVFVVITHQSHLRVAVPIMADRGLKSSVARTFEETKAYMMVDIKQMKIIKTVVKPFTFAPTDFMGILRFLKKEKAQIVVNNDMHSLLYFELRRINNMDVYPNFGNVKDVEGTIKLLLIDL